MALGFNSDTTEVDCGSDSSLDNLAALTVVAWVYHDGTNTTIPRIVTKVDTGGTVGWDFNIRNFASNTRRIRFQRHYTTTDLDVRSANSAVNLNDWSFVAVTDGGAGVAPRIYYGDLDTIVAEEASYNQQDTPAGSLASDAAESLLIGNDPNGGTARGWGSDIWRVGIYSAALTLQDLIPMQFGTLADWVRSSSVGLYELGGPQGTGTQRDFSAATGLRNGTANNATAGTHPPLPRRAMLLVPRPVPAGGGGTFTTSNAGTIVYTGNAGTRTTSTATANAGTVVYTGQAGTLSTSKATANAATIVYTGQGNTRSTSKATANAATIVYTGVAGNLGTGTFSQTANAGTIVFTGQAGTLAKSLSTSAAATIVFGGNAGTVVRSMLTALVGTIVYTGNAGTLTGATLTGTGTATLTTLDRIDGSHTSATRLDATLGTSVVLDT